MPQDDGSESDRGATAHDVQSPASGLPTRARDGDEGDAFIAPDFLAPISLEQALHACPVKATTLGTFFQFIHTSLKKRPTDAVRAACEGQPTLRWVPFKQYPLRDFMRLAYHAVDALYPEMPRGEGLRRIGWMSYPSFASTMAGRVVLFAFGQRMEDVFSAGPKSYRLGLPNAAVVSRRLGERHYRLEMREVHSFAETYHCGVVEGVILAHGSKPDVRVRRYARSCDVDFDVGWS
jgi:uncharacterized protein (TIGR02265 family)